MKRLFYPFFALAALAMTNTSCQDEMENGSSNANEVAVTFDLQLENAVGSRLAGDGTKATKLQYWVYKAETDTIGKIINGLTGTATVQGHKAEVSLTLVKGQTYNFLFSAQAPQCTYYTPVPAEGVITVNNYVSGANDESRDAFFKVRKNLKVTGPVTETIVLKRPFSQINVGTSIGSLADAKKADVDITKSNFTVDNAATRLNTYSGSATVSQAVSYSMANIIESNKADKEGDLKNVDGKDYEHLAMNYILVADYTDNNTTDEYGVGENKQLVNTTFEIFDNNNASINKFEVPNVPVQRNWRTNIVGDILNESVTFNVVIDPTFDKDHNYITHEELAYAALNGGTVTLKEDVVLDNYLDVKGNMIVNLNGHSISATKTNFDDETCTVFYVEDGAKLTINGNGNVKAMAGSAYDMAIWAVGGEVTINGGTFENLGATDKGCDVIYAKFGAVVNIYGGSFKAGNTNKESFADKTNGVWAALNLHGSATGSINVYGGKFYKFNPAVPGTESATWNDSHPNGFVAEGYKSVKVGDDYVVVPNEVSAVVANATDLTSALAAEEPNVVLAEDVEATSTIVMAKGGVLDGNGNAISGTLTSYSTPALNTKGGVIKNISIVTGCQYSIAADVLTEDLYIENVTTDKTGYGINLRGSGTQYCLYATNSTFKGWSSFTGLKQANFKNCEFGQGEYWVNKGYADAYDRLLKPYVNTVFENCTFEKGFYLDLSAFTGTSIKFINCTVDGVALTKDMFKNSTESTSGNQEISELGDKKLWRETTDANWAMVTVE